MRTPPALLAACTLVVAACGQPIDGAAPSPAPVVVASAVVDGDPADWPEGVHALTSGGRLYLRVRTATPTTLARPAAPLRVAIDVDGSAESGEPVGEIGADLELVFGDPGRGDRRGPPFTVRAPGRDVAPTPAELGLIAGPTHTGVWHEVRLDLGSPALPGGPGAGPPRFVVVAGGGVVTEPAGVARAVAAVSNAPAVTASVPGKADGTIRVMTWNVLWRSPLERPGPFARVIAAVRPDVILFEEWARDDIADESVAGWLNAHAATVGDATAPWQAETNGSWGVAVASRLPIVARGPDGIAAEGTRWDYPVRLAAAAVRTPAGPMVFGAVHTKCCGGPGTEEDTRRLAEARAINEVLSALADEAGAAMVVLGGDFNLVGTPEVIEEATRGLDVDGSPLAPAAPRVLGDPGATYTFVGRPDNPAIPPRLDYITYPDAAMDVVGAFVLHTAVLDDAARSASGLLKDDTWASDHLPVVVDLRPRE